MKRLPKNLVALVFFSILVFGFFSSDIARAIGVAPTTASFGETYTYQGNHVWKSPTGVVKTDAELWPGTQPNPYVAAENTFDGVAAGSANAANLTPANPGANIDAPLGKFGETGVKAIGNLAGGIANLIFNPLLATTIVILEAIVITLHQILAIAGGIFDISILFSLTKMRDLFTSGAITTIWALVRDTLNIAFIFILLYIAIKMILGSITSKAKSTLISVVVSALFINFSMFFAKVLIDFGNVIALSLYDKMTVGHVVTSGGLSLMLLKGSTLSTLLGLFTLSGQTNLFVTNCLNIITLFLLIWVFGYGAFIFLGRAVMLILLVVTSPIAFVGSSIPMLKKYRDEWWENFTDQIMVAPLFMFMLYVVSTLMTELDKATHISWKSVFNPDLDIAGYFYYFFMIFFLIKGMALVKKLSHGAGAMALKIVGGAAVAAAAVVAAPFVLPALPAIAGAAGSAGGAAATGRRLAQMGARLASTSKQYGGIAKKFVTGSFDKSTGIGMVADYARGEIMSGVKGATGGSIDPKAMETWIKKRQGDTKKAHEDAIAPLAKELAEQEQNAAALIVSQKKIETEAKEKLEKERDPNMKEAKKVTQDEHNKNKEKLGEAEVKHREVNIKSPNHAVAIGKAAQELTAARSSFAQSEKRVADFIKNDKERLDVLKEEIAVGMGTTTQAIVDGIAQAPTKIAAIKQKIEVKLSNIEQSGLVGGLVNHAILDTPEGKKKFTNSLREFVKRGGKETDDEKMANLFKKALKDNTSTSQPPPTTPPPTP